MCWCVWRKSTRIYPATNHAYGTGRSQNIRRFRVPVLTCNYLYASDTRAFYRVVAVNMEHLTKCCNTSTLEKQRLFYYRPGEGGDLPFWTNFRKEIKFQLRIKFAISDSGPRCFGEMSHRDKKISLLKKIALLRCNLHFSSNLHMSENTILPLIRDVKIKKR